MGGRHVIGEILPRKGNLTRLLAKKRFTLREVCPKKIQQVQGHRVEKYLRIIKEASKAEKK
jgi:hypothetical protein